MIEAEFGFLPSRLAIQVGDLEIEPRPDFDEIVIDMDSWRGVERNWIYAPEHSRIFSLPMTHKIKITNTSDLNYLKFQVWILSFFLGIRLTTTEMGFLDATPIKLHQLVDFHPSNSDLRKAIAIGHDFWLRHVGISIQPKRFCAAIHSLFLSEGPRYLQFERFIYLYTAFDACYALAEEIRAPPRRIPHFRRIHWLCDQFNVNTPGWARPQGKASPEVAALRNATLHEALFADEPLGFGVHGIGSNQNLLLEMKALVCRLLVVILGASTLNYVGSPVNTRMMYSLDLV